MEAVDELGYVPNPAARALVTRRTDAVALVIAESEERIFGEPFFAGVVRGISAALDDASAASSCCRWRRPTTGAPARATTSPGSTSTACCCCRCTTTTGVPGRSRTRGAARRARRPVRRTGTGVVRRRRQRRRRATGRGTPGRDRPSSDRDDHGPARHGGRPRPPRGLPRRAGRRWPAARRATSSSRATSARTAAGPACDDLLAPAARHRRSVRGQRPDGDGCHAGAAGRTAERAGRRRGRRVRRDEGLRDDGTAVVHGAPAAGRAGPGDGRDAAAAHRNR